MLEIDGDAGAANAVIETSKDSHALYVSRLERDQVREVSQELPVDFDKVILLCKLDGLSNQGGC